MWNDPAANTDGSAPAETPEQPEPAYESKQDEPSRPDPPAADPRRLEAADEEDADPLASLPADFAAFSLTQTHPRSGDAKAEPFEQQRQSGSRVRQGDETECESTHPGTRRASASTATRAPTARAAASSRTTSRSCGRRRRGGGCPSTRRSPAATPRRSAPSTPTAAASTRTRAACRRRMAWDSLSTRRSPNAHRSRSSSTCGRRRRRRRARSTRRACVATAWARVPTAWAAPTRTAPSRAARKNQLFAPSTQKRVGPRTGGAPAARAGRAAGRADRRRQSARAAPRHPRQR